MATQALSTLDARTLARRLGELAGDERKVQVEVDHIDAAGRGGAATLENLRLACRQHNLLHAERVYGREFMEKYRKNESTTAGGSGPAWPMVREAQATG